MGPEAPGQVTLAEPQEKQIGKETVEMTSPPDRWGPYLGASNLGAGQQGLGEVVGKTVRSYLFAEGGWKAQRRCGGGRSASKKERQGFKGVP